MSAPSKSGVPLQLHPYYPLEAEIVGYLANDYTVPQLLLTFAGACVVIFALTSVLVKRVNPRLARGDELVALWFVLSGSIHFFFEGYFAINHARMGSSQDLFGQMWKEYAHSDSRYLTSESFVLCMESITAALWGPLSFVLLWLIVTSHPLRHPLQIIVSGGQIYGDILYYATAMFDHYHKGVTYCRPEAYYFWGYYFALNFIWIVIPSMTIYQSVTSCSRAFKALDKMSLRLQANGSVKKVL
ncbi:MAG: hypothetical protein M1833_002037 [Piccolia ochrophora]|nr:MAG: hypothetical protein M1833_002037 [Piccolia ochrophora]